MTKVLYRYEIEYQSEDGPTNIRLREIPVLRETEKCYFIARYYWGSQEKRVLKNAYNTYAYASKEAAKQHFIRRTHKRISWFEFWIEECKKGLELIEESEDGR